MNQGVKLILDRLKTNPEDFLPHGKFRNVADNLTELAGGRAMRIKASTDPVPLYFLTDEERQLLKDAWVECAREQFTAQTMRTLMAEDESKDEYRYYPQSAGGLQIGAPYNTANSQLSATQMALQNDIVQREMRAQSYIQQAKQAK